MRPEDGGHTAEGEGLEPSRAGVGRPHAVSSGAPRTRTPSLRRRGDSNPRRPGRAGPRRLSRPLHLADVRLPLPAVGGGGRVPPSCGGGAPNRIRTCTPVAGHTFLRRVRLPFRHRGLVAGTGFEPATSWIMSPASYQLLHPAPTSAPAGHVRPLRARVPVSSCPTRIRTWSAGTKSRSAGHLHHGAVPPPCRRGPRADDGNRTRIAALARRCSTTELRPRSPRADRPAPSERMAPRAQWSHGDSNPAPLPCEGSALPA